jgi:hypothetical protein
MTSRQRGQRRRQWHHATGTGRLYHPQPNSTLNISFYRWKCWLCGNESKSGSERDTRRDEETRNATDYHQLTVACSGKWRRETGIMNTQTTGTKG